MLETQSSSPSDEVDIARKSPEPVTLMQDDIEIVDSVPWSVYVAWIRSSGGFMGGLINVILIMTTHIFFLTANMLTSLALSWWVSGLYGLSNGQYVSKVPPISSHENSFDVEEQIAIYSSLGVAQSIFSLAFSTTTCYAGTKASQTMSNKAMWRILRAPIVFFDTTPLGRIIHRFTKDVDTMDNNLTDSVRQYIVVISSLASVFILIIVYFPPCKCQTPLQMVRPSF